MFVVLYAILIVFESLFGNRKLSEVGPDYENMGRNLDVPLRHIEYMDPNFSMDGFIRDLTNMTNTILDAYEKRDYESLSGVFHKKMLLAQSEIIRRYIEKELYPHYLDREFSSFSIVFYQIMEGHERLDAHFEISLYEFVLDGNGQVVCGDNRNRSIMKCDVCVQRPKGAKTPAAKTIYCEQCGAALDNPAGKCPYCGCVTIAHNLGWELISISFDDSTTWGNI